MTLATLAAFWGVSLLFIVTPGADWAYAISAGLRNRSPIPAVAGMLTGHFGATLVVAAGVGALVASWPIALTALTVGGAGYLIWIGIGMLRSPGVAPGPDSTVAPAAPIAPVRQGCRHQRPQPESLPPLPRTVAPVHRPAGRAAAARADHFARPRAHRKLLRRLPRRRVRGQESARCAPWRGALGDARLWRHHDRNRHTPARGEVLLLTRRVHATHPGRSADDPNTDPELEPHSTP